MTLEIGQQAPSFSLAASGGQKIALEDYAGKKIVLFFYPKASTPGCTTEAIDFTSLKSEFDALNVTILGASKDSIRRQDNFTAKNELTIPLLSDEEGSLVEDYGVWVEKKMYGKTFLGIERATFLIDEAGSILNIWHKVKVKGHAQAVLDHIKGL